MALVEVDVDAHLAILTLNRPEARNALSVEMCNEIVAALERIDGSDARVVVLRGEGKAFCAGADLAAVGSGGLEFLPAFERMLEATARFRLPTIASIHGPAIGGGLQLATVCDFRLCAESAKLGIPSSRLGILVNFENVQRLVLLAGVAVAKEVLMTGRLYSGPEAASAGLVHRCVGDDELTHEAGAFAGQVAAGAPLSVQGTKKAIQVVADHLSGAVASSPEAVASIGGLVAEAYASEDLAEGLAAGAERRPPEFKGR